jgi:hypothetical protein
MSSCQFNETEESSKGSNTSIEHTPLEKSIIINKEGVYLLGKTWDPNSIDSIQKANPSWVYINGSTPLTFITNSNDSIILNPYQITQKESVIVFNEMDGPILTTYSRIGIYIIKKHTTSEINKNKDENVINNKTDSISTSNIQKNNRTLHKLQFLKNKTIPKLAISKVSTLYYKVDSINPSKLYPFIPNKKNLEIHFDNDFWDYTDYYYTNGIRIGYIHPVFVHSPLSYLLISNGDNGIDYYGIQLIQNMYTGTKPKVDSIIQGDRPWAAYTYLGEYATSFDWRRKIKHETQINFGIIGPESGGGFLQDLVHTILPNNSPPEGWDNQIKQDIIIDYQYRITKSLYELNNFESYLRGSIQVGTLRDNLKWGFGARYGKFTPFYNDIQNISNFNHSKKLKYSFFMDIETQLIGYDATLQGGVTDRTSVYIIPSKDMERFVISGYLGMEVTYKNMQLQFIQYWKSKEFTTGKDHKYVSVRLYIGF